MDVPHYCTGCGQQHGGPARESEEVKIAKINADRDIEVARLARGAAKIEAEAEVEVAELATEAAVEQTAIEAEAVVEVGELPEPEPEPEPDPVIVETAEPDEEPGPAEPPEISGNQPSSHSGGGYWGAYSG